MKGSVLVVDDEKIVLESCKRILEPKGYMVTTSESPVDALEKLKADNIDLVITDIKMPQMDGIEFMRQIREFKPHMNIVLITGYPSQESLKEALELRIVDYLPKPFSPALLLEVTEKAFLITAKAAEPTPEAQAYTEETAQKLDDIIEAYPKEQASLIPILQHAQKLVGYLPPVVLRHVANMLNVPVSEVHGVVSFYSYFSMSPKGKHNIKVCLGTACYVKRAEEIVERLKEQLGIELGGVTEDFQFSLESIRCLGACGLAPVVVVDEDTYGAIDPVKTHEIVDKYKNGGSGDG